MYLIAGLGNPGTKYEGTRHNIGWQVIDELAEKYNIRVLENKFKGLTGKGMIGSEKVLLLKPLTYMNLSGESIAEAVRFYKIDETTELIVIADDISLDVGQIIMGLRISLHSLDMKNLPESKWVSERSLQAMIWRIMCLVIFRRKRKRSWQRAERRQ